MKKLYFNLIYASFVLTLIFLFFYNAFKITETRTETMVWKSGGFEFTGLTNFIGLALLISIPGYFVLKKKLSQKIKK